MGDRAGIEGGPSPSGATHRSVGRDAFLRGALFLSVAAVVEAVAAACAPVIGQPSKPDLTLVPTHEPFETVPLDEAISYVRGEITANPNLPSLRDYPAEKIETFMGHCYRIFTALTGSRISADKFLEMTKVGNVDDMRRAFRDGQTSLGIPPHQLTKDEERALASLAAAVYPVDGKPANLAIAVNQDHPYFQLSSLRNAVEESFPPPNQRTVLGYLFSSVTAHEPLHFEAGIKPLAQPVTYRVGRPDVQFTFTQSFGLQLRGKDNLGKFVGPALSSLDEASLFILQKGYFKPRLDDLYQEYPDLSQATLAAVKDLLQVLGYKDIDAIHQLRGKNAIELVKGIAAGVPRDQIPPGFTAEDVAFNVLVSANLLIGNDSPASREQLRAIIELLKKDRRSGIIFSERQSITYAQIVKMNLPLLYSTNLNLYAL